MNYELAKELKDAGFPQARTVGGDYYVGTTKHHAGTTIPLDINYIPTLSELIEACGEEFVSLRQVHLISPRAPWAAGGYRLSEDRGMEFFEVTPLEAVARLWLALNKK